MARDRMGTRFERLTFLGHPDYFVTDRGNVWSCFRGRWKLRRPRKSRYGYLELPLNRGGKQTWFRVHHLVLLAFVGPRPPGTEGCHFPDRDPTNNGAENLRWDTPKANMADQLFHGTRRRGERHGMARLRDEDVSRIHAEYAAGASQKEIAARLGVCRQTVGDILNGTRFPHCQPAVKAKPRQGGSHGEKHPQAKLTWADVLEMRRLYATGAYTVAQLARMFRVNWNTADRAVTGKTWHPEEHTARREDGR